MRCATPSCGFEGEILDRSNDGLPSPFVKRKFEQKGWEVGASERHDFCPKCVEAQRVERRQRRSGVKRFADLKLVTTNEGEAPMQATAVADAPQPMTRDDRRIIFAKLSEVYVDENSGYQSGWSDKRVATDLGVPQAWVATIREENFGPAADNQEIRDMLARVESNATEAKKLLLDAKAVRAEGASLVERINDLNRRAADIGKNLDGLLTLADRIKAAVV